MFEYPAKIDEQEDGSFLVTFRDLPYGATDGETLEEAKMEARDCLEEVIAGCIDDKQDIPETSKPKSGEYMIPVPAQTAAKTALYIAVRKVGVSNSGLARRLDVNEKEVRRMLDPRHPTKLPRIEAALKALGYHLTVTMVEAAA